MFTYCPPKELADLKSQTFPDGKRYYTTPDGVKLPSVTTVIGAKGKQAILEWRKRVGDEEANKISRKATSRGTNVHTLCERYLNNESLGDIMPDAKEMFLPLKPILNRINNIHYQECALWSLQLGMAGRVDCIAEFDGVLSVIDFKTSRRPKKKEDIDNYFAQCVAYACMYEEMIGVGIDQIVIIMAVEGSEPLVFVEKTENHLNTLLEYIKYYRENQ
jgi:CRISPR/Cas system-associated exonuclease Cas4 (RecB family)